MKPTPPPWLLTSLWLCCWPSLPCAAERHNPPPMPKELRPRVHVQRMFDGGVRAALSSKTVVVPADSPKPRPRVQYFRLYYLDVWTGSAAPRRRIWQFTVQRGLGHLFWIRSTRFVLDPEATCLAFTYNFGYERLFFCEAPLSRELRTYESWLAARESGAEDAKPPIEHPDEHATVPLKALVGEKRYRRLIRGEVQVKSIRWQGGGWELAVGSDDGEGSVRLWRKEGGSKWTLLPDKPEPDDKPPHAENEAR